MTPNDNAKRATAPGELKLFGTDGIRGTFGEAPLDEPTVRRLAWALAAHLHAHHETPPLVVLGGDTRFSTPTVSAWLAGGLAAGGVEVVDLGTVTTPCVAHAAKFSQASCGVAISASHNPYPDNGIKLIDHRGFKWAPSAEAEIEALMGQASPREIRSAAAPPAENNTPIVDAYLDSLRQSVGSSGSLSGLRVALDTANGAASPFATPLFESLGAEVVAINHRPDGRNINLDCGSTHPQALAELTRGEGCDVGFAFDGDADRVIVADEGGAVRDGDAILYLWSRDLARRDALPGRRIVATSMSNLGLEVALRREGIGVERCDVGDREVVATLLEQGLVLGGEQSGHIVHLGLGTTGDGMLTALQIAALCRRQGGSLSGQLAGLTTFPQLLRNVRVRSKPALETLQRVVEAREDIERRLGESGRLVLRYSGTEPLVRIMIEGRERAEIERHAEQLAVVLAEELS